MEEGSLFHFIYPFEKQKEKDTLEKIDELKTLLRFIKNCEGEKEELWIFICQHAHEKAKYPVRIWGTPYDEGREVVDRWHVLKNFIPTLKNIFNNSLEELKIK